MGGRHLRRGRAPSRESDYEGTKPRVSRIWHQDFKAQRGPVTDEVTSTQPRPYRLNTSKVPWISLNTAETFTSSVRCNTWEKCPRIQ